MKYIPLLLLCAGCQCPPFDFETRLGTGVYLDGVTDSDLTSENVSDMEDEVNTRLRAFGLLLNADRRADGVAVINLRNSVWHCLKADPSAWCAGTQTDQFIVVANSPHCPWRSAIRHELTHLGHQANGLPADYNHKRPEWAEVVADPAIGCFGFNTPGPQ